MPRFQFFYDGVPDPYERVKLARQSYQRSAGFGRPEGAHVPAVTVERVRKKGKK